MFEKRIGMGFLRKYRMRCSDSFRACEIRVGFGFTVLNIVLILGILGWFGERGEGMERGCFFWRGERKMKWVYNSFKEINGLKVLIYPRQILHKNRVNYWVLFFVFLSNWVYYLSNIIIGWSYAVKLHETWILKGISEPKKIDIIYTF